MKLSRGKFVLYMDSEVTCNSCDVATLPFNSCRSRKINLKYFLANLIRNELKSLIFKEIKFQIKAP